MGGEGRGRGRREEGRGEGERDGEKTANLCVVSNDGQFLTRDVQFTYH